MNDRPICGAMTHAGMPCQRSPCAGKSRCRFHGGALGSGAPEAERNGNYKHGLYSRSKRAERMKAFNTPWKPLSPPVK